MAAWLIFIGVGGLLLDVPASEIVSMQAVSWIVGSFIFGILDGLKARREMRKQEAW